MFGRYIHTYKFDQAVREGVVLDLRYEARDIDQTLTNKDKIDQWFEAKTKGLNDAQLRQQLVEDFAGHGIGEERLILVSWDATHFDHMNRYNQVDIGLDPFPCNGGTTSFDAMWMGVPVVTLAGDRFISRMGVSMLTSLGLSELVADTPEDYVAIAARLAGDINRLAALRAGLRERMANSPLTDAKRFTLNLEKAYREMWQSWCDKPQGGTR